MAIPAGEDAATLIATRRHRLETRAGWLLLTGVLAMGLICSGIIVSGWFAGVLWDPAERVFWAGSICGLLMVIVFALANLPGGRDDTRAIRTLTWLLRAGILLFIAAPILCLSALVADFFHI